MGAGARAHGGVYAAREPHPARPTGAMPGGLLTTASIVENAPAFPKASMAELMVRMQKQAERFGARIKFGVVESVELFRCPIALRVDGETVESQTLIIASGAGHRHLGLVSERQLERKGVTYCATCDGALPMFRNQPVVVIGGGDSACEEAVYLTRFASEVHLVHRRDTLRASKIMAERASTHPKIKPIWNTVITEVLDVRQDRVTGVRLKNLQTQAESVLDCAGVFVAIGHVPNTQLFKGVLDMDANGYLLPKRGAQTNVPGVFVAGDCADRIYRQAITAAGQVRRRHRRGQFLASLRSNGSRHGPHAIETLVDTGGFRIRSERFRGQRVRLNALQPPPGAASIMKLLLASPTM